MAIPSFALIQPTNSPLFIWLSGSELLVSESNLLSCLGCKKIFLPLLLFSFLRQCRPGQLSLVSPQSATMAIIDSELELAETDAVPHSPDGRKEELGSSNEKERPSSSGTSSTASSSSVDYNPQFHALHSQNTEVDLERHQTRTSDVVSRIHTQRLQHAHTVGESVKSRSSKGPLPAFGGGKPYPPPLPNREEYVVEFDGPDDPLYPQNWPLKRK